MEENKRLVRKPVSEYEFRDKLQKEGWYTILSPGSQSPVDIIAIQREEDWFANFNVIAYQVKETIHNTLYLTSIEIEILEKWSKDTKIPVKLAVKFKGSGRRKPIWKIVDPTTTIKRKQ